MCTGDRLCAHSAQSKPDCARDPPPDAREGNGLCVQNAAFAVVGLVHSTRLDLGCHVSQPYSPRKRGVQMQELHSTGESTTLQTLLQLFPATSTEDCCWYCYHRPRRRCYQEAHCSAQRRRMTCFFFRAILTSGSLLCREGHCQANSETKVNVLG